MSIGPRDAQPAVEARVRFYGRETADAARLGHLALPEAAELLDTTARLLAVVSSSDPDGETPDGDALTTILRCRLQFEAGVGRSGMYETGVKLAECCWRLEDYRFWREQADENRPLPSLEPLRLALDDFDAEFDPDYLVQQSFDDPRHRAVAAHERDLGGAGYAIRVRIESPVPIGSIEPDDRETARIAREPYEIPMNDVLSDGRPSATIKAIGYDQESRVLQVEFVSGARYRYRDVDPDVYAAFLSAPSKGTYFDRQIKKKGYSYRRVTA